VHLLKRSALPPLSSTTAASSRALGGIALLPGNRPQPPEAAVTHLLPSLNKRHRPPAAAALLLPRFVLPLLWQLGRARGLGAGAFWVVRRRTSVASDVRRWIRHRRRLCRPVRPARRSASASRVRPSHLVLRGRGCLGGDILLKPLLHLAPRRRSGATPPPLHDLWTERESEKEREKDGHMLLHLCPTAVPRCRLNPLAARAEASSSPEASAAVVPAYADRRARRRELDL
jgi:hypothetical protein